MQTNLLSKLRDGEKLTLRQQLFLTLQLAVPAILAQISTTVMEYFDASMVGQLGANASASIGLVASTTWLFGGINSAAATGFTVQVTQAIGAKDNQKARNLMRQGFAICLLFSLGLSLIGFILSGPLPVLLGGTAEITKGASQYFFVYALTVPIIQLAILSGGMLQGSGNMRTPSIVNIFMCVVNVLFNRLLIFPAGEVSVFGAHIFIPGAGLGIIGAALGTLLAELSGALIMVFFLFLKNPMLRIRKNERTSFRGEDIKRAAKIAIPVGVESAIMGGAYVVFTRIVSPLGNISIAAHSFSVTAESLCYMPGYGIAMAATTLVGQSIGAGRRALAKRMGWISISLGMIIQGLMGVLLYFGAPLMLSFLTPDPDIQALGTACLRIEAFAEPLFAASIVSSGVFRGAGDTLVPSIMNFISMWAVRLVLAAILVPKFGLQGAWIAMLIDLCFRGGIFLARMASGKWIS